MSLTRLPTETISTILEFADPSDVYWFQQVCRRFCDLVATNQYLQYVRELGMCGYVVPLIPRTDLRYTDKINALREHRKRWRNTKLVQPKFIELHSHPDSDRLICFIGGTFVCGETDPYSDQAEGSNRKIDFHQLASFNKGIEYKYWQHVVSARALQQLTIQPEYDLLVLLEQTSVQGDTSIPDDFYTFSSRAYHERYRTGLDFDITSTGYFSPHWKYELQVYGGLVAAMLSSTWGTHLVIWNWLSGSQVARIDMPGTGTHHLFRFLSENYLIIPVLNNSRENESSRSYKALGYLMLYHLPAHDHEAKTSVHCVAEFILPDHDLRIARLRLSTDAALAPAMATSSIYQRTQLKPLPKIFEAAPGNHLIHITITSETSIISDECESGALIVSAQALLDTLVEADGAERAQSGRTTQIPWKAWGHFTSWVNTCDTKARSFWCEQRLAALQDVSIPPPPLSPLLSVDSTLAVSGSESPLAFPRSRDISCEPDQTIHMYIWGLDRNRLQERRAKDCKNVEEIDPSCPAEPSESDNVGSSIDQAFSRAVPSPSRQYTRTDIKLEEVATEKLGAVMIGDEHIVIEVASGWDSGWDSWYTGRASVK